jgi:hypothetical protein
VGQADDGDRNRRRRLALPRRDRAIDHFDPDLTIRGMLEIYRRNTAKA